MSTQVIQTGSAVRVVVTGRGITDADIIQGDLVLNYNDGTSKNVGQVAAPSVNDAALTSRVNGDLLVSPMSGEELIGAG